MNTPTPKRSIFVVINTSEGWRREIIEQSLRAAHVGLGSLKESVTLTISPKPYQPTTDDFDMILIVSTCAVVEGLLTCHRKNKSPKMIILPDGSSDSDTLRVIEQQGIQKVFFSLTEGVEQALLVKILAGEVVDQVQNEVSGEPEVSVA